jgi:hypothetical protein
MDARPLKSRSRCVNRTGWEVAGSIFLFLIVHSAYVQRTSSAANRHRNDLLELMRRAQ